MADRQPQIVQQNLSLMKHLLGEELPGRETEHLPENPVAVRGTDAQLCGNIIDAKRPVFLYIMLELLVDKPLQAAADLVGKLYLLISSRSMQIRLNRERLPQLAEQVEDRRLQHHPLGHGDIPMDCG